MATSDSSHDLDPKVARAIQDAVDTLRAELLGHLKPQATAAPPGAGAGDRLVRLESAVEALDSASTQTKLLASFLEEAGAFADRTMFLVRDTDELNGWAAFGFSAGAEAVQRVSVACPGEVAGGRPVDDAAVGAALRDQLGASQADQSIMVPFALRGKVAGALYADRAAGGEDLDRPALRILGYVAAQALETLPLRRPAGDAGVTPPLAEPEREPEAETDASEVVARQQETVELEVQEPDVGAEAPDQASEVEVDVDQMIEEVEPEPYGDENDTDIVAIRHDVTPAGFEAVEEDEDDFVTDQLDTAIEEIEREEAGAIDSPKVIGGLPPGGATSTVESDLADLEGPVRVEPPSRAIDASEVAPPTDLEGPGWAFSGSESISDDTRHEEARRLARLLVTEIKLYNEEKVREGRETNSLYSQLKDDIERSRRIYEERIDDEVREEVDYFQEEVVRILAGGDSTALGA